jgi:putative addiction module component (TIGR02574 family)
MTKLAETIAEQALLLPREDRAELVEKLLSSLNVPTQEEVDRLWAEEAERRIQEYDEGKVAPLDGERVMDEIRKRLNR